MVERNLAKVEVASSSLVSRSSFSRSAVSLARWQSGHAAACKAVYAGSIPTLASPPMKMGISVTRCTRPWVLHRYTNVFAALFTRIGSLAALLYSLSTIAYSQQPTSGNLKDRVEATPTLRYEASHLVAQPPHGGWDSGAVSWVALGPTFLGSRGFQAAAQRTAGSGRERLDRGRFELAADQILTVRQEAAHDLGRRAAGYGQPV